jgi:signal transduction histidine kinase
MAPAQMLMRSDINEEDRKDTFRILMQHLTFAKRIMDDVWHISKPRAVERFPLDVNAALAEIVDAARVQARETNVAVETGYATGPLIIEGDRFGLQRVCRNLITNAIQAMPSGGRLVVATSRADDQIEINVTDTGSGIPADRLTTIFDDFVTTKRNGLGLGLAVSKRIVDQLAGTITVESEEGRGTSFTLRFPARDEGSVQAEAS